MYIRIKGGIEMTLAEQYEPYINKQGLISADGGIHQNDVRVSSVAMEIARRKKDWAFYSFLFKNLQLREQNGLLSRADDNDEQDSMDNYVPFLYSLADTSSAKRIYEHGLKNFWYYRNGRPGKFGSAYFGRYPAFRYHATLCGGPEASVLNLPYRALCYTTWRGAIYHATHYTHSDQDGWILSWFLLLAALRKYPGLKPVQDKWSEMLAVYWQHGLGQVLHKYYNLPNGVMHPNAEHLWDVYA